MKTLTVSIYRSDYDCSLNYFFGSKNAQLICADGIERGDNKHKYVAIIKHPAGEQFGEIAVPVDENGNEIQKANCCRMSGGTYISTSDSRFPKRHPVSLHDRFEPYRS